LDQTSLTKVVDN